MLDYIRKRSGGFVSFFIIGAIALVFVFWGVGGQNTGDGSEIVLDDENISVYTYLERKREDLDALKNEDPGADPETLNRAAARRTISYLAQRHVMRKLAAATGRMVPDGALIREITSQPAFQDDQGLFQKSIYERYVTMGVGLTVASFESRYRDDILVRDAAEFVRSLSFVPDAAIMERWRFAQDRAKLDYVFFPASFQKAGLEPTEEEMALYREAHKGDFVSPEAINLDYVTVTPPEFMEGTEATEEEIRLLYEEELPRFTTPPAADARHILFRFPSFTPSPSQKEAVLEKARAALIRSEKEDFSELAKELSEDPATAPEGGALKNLKKGATDPAFEKAVFADGAQSPGKVLGPVETNFGYHLIVVDEIRPETVKPLEEARGDLERQIRERKARRSAVNKIEDLSEKAQREPGTELKDLALSMGLKVESTGLFTRDNPPDWLKDPMELQRVMNSPLKVVSLPLDAPETPDSPERLVIYMPTEKNPSRPADLSDPETRQAVRQAWIEATSLDLARKKAEVFLTEAGRLGFQEAVSRLPEGSGETGTTDFFPRLGFLNMAKAPVNAADPILLTEALFQLNEPGDAAPKPIPVTLTEGEGFLVCALNAFQPAELKDFENRESFLRAEARESFGDFALSLWTERAMAGVKTRLPREITEDLSGEIQLN
ncbi:MAG: SurA N-terminal domain-containing protein [Deltaproteobacteria bacterium]|jgi:peptidyl-prolyl cis-trans isomerase D|nr:SurA N-terminal domain-containing protein [Deltaproteobacteria bacterium]